MHRVLGDRRAIALLLGPALLVYSLIMLVPMVWSLGYSFTKGNTINGFTGNGVANFSRLLDDPAVHDALWFTLKYAVVVTAGQVVAGYLLAPGNTRRCFDALRKDLASHRDTGRQHRLRGR
ncbi:hypothetical protein AB0O04_37245, partial [Streptomyces althioticus]|uniref:carbohydrate ABC transporter permease n=1 Tax=Streptomyces althioticus TaxID=83380 RepID=UPI00347311FB